MLPAVPMCDHCGYTNKYEAERLKKSGAEGAWCCPSCSLCNTTYHKPSGFVTTLGYQRNLEVGMIEPEKDDCQHKYIDETDSYFYTHCMLCGESRGVVL